MVTSTIQNLIFDLGGVLLDLHVDRSHQAFARLANIPVENIPSKVAAASCFVDHEKGLVSDAEFRQSVREMLGTNATDDEIDHAWNAMLGDIPLERLQLLKQLRKDFRVFLLSNTNAIHVPRYTATVRVNSGETSLDPFFDKVYFSHVLKMRKPDEEIFRHVLDQNKLVPENTLFLDDFPVNLIGAQKTGIKTFHVQGPQSIFALFS